MLLNYFRTWFRNILKYRTYAAINLLGLGIGIACCYLCVLYLLYDWSFDRFHQDYHHIYRVTGKMQYWKRMGGPIAGTWAETVHFPVPLASVMSVEIPEIETATSVKDIKSFPPTNKAMWRVGIHENFLRDIEDVVFVDSNFVEIFSFPIISGTFPSTPGQVVITRAFAQTLSNNIDSLVGQMLWMQPPARPFSRNQQNAVPVEIGGIVETPPRNSSLTFEVLVPLTMYSTFRKVRNREWDWSFSSNHYVRLSDESPVNVVEEKLTQTIQKRSSFNSSWDVSTFEAKLQPITDLHHIVGGIGDDGVRPGTNPIYGYILSGMGILVLSVACLNYVLLYVARFNSRTKELSIRQIFGANRRQLRYQLLVECFGYSILACIIGMAVAELASSPLEGVLKTSLMSSTDPIQTAIILLSIACLIGLSTAIYPAAFMSSVSAVSVLNKTAKAARSGPFLKILMAIQSGVTLVFVFCTIIIFQQTYFVVTADPGFEPANLARLSITGLTQNEVDRLQASLSGHPLVATCVREIGSAGIQMRNSNGNSIDEVITYEADGDFLKTVGLKLLQGKSLYPNPIQGDVIVNEAFLKRLTSAQPLGQVITQADENTSSRVFGRNVSGRIVGVVKDFHFRDLRHTAPPTVIAIADDATTFLFKGKYITGEILIRVQEGSAEAFGTYLMELWKDLKIGGLLTFSYVEDERQKFYAKEISWSKIVSGAALCAVLIASMGALGMISLAVARRRKEIAIRRVMGAVPSKIASGIVLNYALPGLVAAIIALPLSYFFMDEWLSIFAYRFQFGVGTILTAILLGILLPLVCGFVHALKVASDSPIEALRED